jgi:HAD superfamily 5'-nucleotidase-like hydrolase
MKPKDIVDMYGEARHISQEYRNTNMRPLNDLFSLAEACLLSDTIEYFDQTGVDYDPRAVVEDIQAAIVETHHSGKMHNAVLDNLDDYITPSPLVRKWLERLKEGGKKLFVSSNSGYLYMKQTLNHTVGPDWQDLFDVVITGAQKPRFYTGTRPFRRINALTGMVDTAPVKTLDQGNERPVLRTV